MENKYENLCQSVIQIGLGNQKIAQNILDNFKKNLNPSVDSSDLQYLLFCSALLKRIDINFEFPNIYLHNFSETSQATIFHTLATKFPFISLAHSIANEIICQSIKSSHSIVLVDIGIGKGAQELELLRQLFDKQIIPKIKIFGIDPFQDNLREAEFNISSCARKLGFELDFYPIPKLIEDLTEQEWLNLTSVSGDLIINAAFSLHHTHTRKIREENQIDVRQKIIKKIYDLHPKSFILIEPSSDHNTLDLWYRFQNAWNHFGLTFEVIDLLNIEREEKFLLKQYFFGREIDDILGNEETKRSERHELVDIWLQRLSVAGFKLCNWFDFSMNFSEPIVDVVFNNKGYVGIQYKGTPIVTVMCGQN